MSLLTLITTAIDSVLHLDVYLPLLIAMFGVWSYAIIFFIIFMETGFVFTPFLPGDSLLFAAGAFAATASGFNVWLLLPLLALAAILGDSVNYAVGSLIGHKILAMKSRWIKKHHIDKTHAFFEKHGGKAVVLARFVPFVRTFTPFIAGVGTMTYFRFLMFNMIGGIIWVSIFLFGGYFFGKIPFVQEHFFIVILAIIIISLIPVAVEIIKHQREKKKGSKADNNKNN
jgi:membrane-associated protein